NAEPRQLACRGIIHLWSLDAARTLEDAQAAGPQSVLSLIRQMSDRSWQIPPRLWLVTRGAQFVNDETQGLSPAQATMWGLGRVIREEHPEFWGGLIDISPTDTSEESAKHLYAEISSPSGE